MPGPVSVTSTRQNSSYPTARRVTAPPAGVYFTALSTRLYRASAVHLGSNRAVRSVGSTVRVIALASAPGAAWAEAASNSCWMP